MSDQSSPHPPEPREEPPAPPAEAESDLQFTGGGDADKGPPEMTPVAPEPPPLEEPESEAPEWYYVPADRQRRGPVTLGDLKSRYAAGEIRADNLVYREGMREWTPLAGLPEFRGRGMEPPPVGPSGTAAPDAAASLRSLEDALTHPNVLRWIAYGSGLLGCVVTFISVPLAFLWRSWFTGGLVLLVAFLVLLSLARILDTLEDLRGPEEVEEEEQPS